MPAVFYNKFQSTCRAASPYAAAFLIKLKSNNLFPFKWFQFWTAATRRRFAFPAAGCEIAPMVSKRRAHSRKSGAGSPQSKVSKIKNKNSRMFLNELVYLIFALILVATFALPTSALSPPGDAGDIQFEFPVPHQPAPPIIEDVDYDQPCVSSTYMDVSVKITPQTQMKAVCDKTPQSSCAFSDWHLIPDQDVTPNPPTIQEVTLYFYIFPRITNIADYIYYPENISMTKNTTDGRYHAKIPLADLISSSEIVFLFTASDSMGNVLANPDLFYANEIEFCCRLRTNATPTIDNCNKASGYFECGQVINEAPDRCMQKFYVNDRKEDVCGEPDATGVQHVISATSESKIDILGLDFAVSGDKVDAHLEIAGQIPTAYDAAPIEGYILMVYNPDINDLSTSDLHLENAYAVTFAPDVIGDDPSLRSVLWDGDCLTDPSTRDPLGCKLKTNPDGYYRGVQIVSKPRDTGSYYDMHFELNVTGTGDGNNIPYNLIGAQSTIVTALTSEINLSGGTAFWVADTMPAIRYYNKNYKVDVAETCAARRMNPTTSISTKCVPNNTSNVCIKGDASPADNTCSISFVIPEPINGLTQDYKAYRLTPTTFVEVPIPEIRFDGIDVRFDDKITNLDGATYHYVIITYNPDGLAADSEEAITTCTVADWQAPAAPTITEAVTPSDESGTCRIKWTMPGGDDTLSSFKIVRNGETLPVDIMAAASGSEYSWTDTSGLTPGASYLYRVTAVDASGNTATSASAECVPWDREPPCPIEDLVAWKTYRDDRFIGVWLDWKSCNTPDLAGYRAHVCFRDRAEHSCESFWDFVEVDGYLIPDSQYRVGSWKFGREGTYCYLVESCDKCDILGTCPENLQGANCSGFSDAEVKCILINYAKENVPPSPVADLTAQSSPDGNACVVKWDAICENADRSAFETCANPMQDELIGYKIMRNEGTGVPDPSQADAAGVLPPAANPEHVVDGLDNGVEQCFKVFGVDASGNFGAPEQTAETCCTPRDGIPPDVPAMDNPVPFTSVNCTPSWKSVGDTDVTGYKLHRCNGTAATCTNPVSFTAIAEEIIIAYGLSYADFEVTVNTPYYYCATAEDASGNESAIVGASDNKNCGACVPRDIPPVCENCVAISSCGDYETGASCIPVTTVNTGAHGSDGKFASAGLPGATVLLLDSNNNTVATAVTDANGNYKLEIPENGAVDFNDTFKIVIQIPASQKQGVPCSPGFAGDACYILLNSNIKLSAGAADKKISGIPLPSPGGGRAEAGNPDCNNAIDVRDLLVLKDAFGANSGDANYKTYADFDGNGKIDVEDFLIFKKNFGKTLDAAPTFDATLCKP